MKKYLLYFLILISAFSNRAYPEELDSQGMPVIYLRNSNSSRPWEPDEKYRFVRNDERYLLKIDFSNSLPSGTQFKIGDSEWKFDFGGNGQNIFIDKSLSIDLVAKGANLHTNGIYTGEISFTYTEGNILNVSFDVTETVFDSRHLISGTLPVLYINVYKDSDHSDFENEIIEYNLDHKNYFENAEYWLEVNEKDFPELKGIGSRDNPLPLQIKARGNWTRWGFSKKPFKIKLDKKENLLNLSSGKSKHYALLAHADDNKGFLRNFVSFELGKKIGLPWTPNQHPVELVVNEDYRGLYFLTESIRAEEGRIEISELKDFETDASMITGGYIVELDNYDEDNQIRMPEESCVSNQYLDMLRVTWDTPENYSEIQREFIENQFSIMNRLIGNNDDNIWRYIDLDDLVRYYLVNEIISHTESFHGSTYLFRERGNNQKWHFSPLWDAGNAFSGKTDQYFYDCDPYGNTWIPSFRENLKFNTKLRETWLWFMSNRFEGIFESIEKFANLIAESSKSDHLRWENISHPQQGSPVANNSDLGKRVAEVKDHISKKVKWLVTKFGDYTLSSFEEPERDDTPAEELPDYASMETEDLIITPDNLNQIFYDLTGRTVSQPIEGQIYIVKQNGTYRKIRYKTATAK